MVRRIKAALIGLALTAVSGCVYSTQVADPGVWKFGNGYLVASSDGSAPGTAKPSMPIYSMSNDKLQHSGSGGARAGQIFLPNQEPAWVDRNHPLWAPEIKFIGGRLIAYYSAEDNQLKPYQKPDGSWHYHRCIGMATASGIGPSSGFTPAGGPFCTPAGDYDLIDPSVFTDNNHQNYLLFKRDPQAPGTKQIAITTLDAGGLNPALPTTAILKPTQSWETNGWSSVEAPTMIRKGAFYYLFYSGNLYNTKRYGVGVARCVISYVGGDPRACDFNHSSPDVHGWKNPTNPILGGESHSGAYCGVGHQDVSDDGAVLWYHTYPNQGCTGARQLGAQILEWGADDWPYPRDHPTP
jgi:GH43 family beta-xylosidase